MEEEEGNSPIRVFMRAIGRRGLRPTILADEGQLPEMENAVRFNVTLDITDDDPPGKALQLAELVALTHIMAHRMWVVPGENSNNWIVYNSD